MKKQANKLESLLPWARAMARMRARACTISDQLGVSSAEARRVWREENGQSSPSGLQPSHFDWYLKTPERRYQSALLVLLDQKALSQYPSAVAFTHAYYHFSRMTAGEWQKNGTRDPAFRDKEGDYTIPYSRGFYLVKNYQDSLYPDNSRKCELLLRACRQCRGKYMSHRDEPGGQCPVCASNER
ncbi:FlhC family transcriptional regulator (plasmid) [Polaromonas sp. P1-6]|nr:FlhC family transcriptional regulator [Polaromonas sp. P1-6]